MFLLVKNNHYKQFLFYFALIILTGYGVYQLIASKLQMPMFFNIFNNNPSYGARGLFESYSGWTKDIRIYTRQKIYYNGINTI